MNKENDSRTYAESLLQKYFKTFEYPFTAHQLNSYDQFVANDIPSIIKSSNPILLLEDKIGNTDEYAYRIEIYIGGIEGNKFYIGTPTVSLKAPTVSVKEPTRSIKLSKSVKSSKSIKAPTVSVSKEQIKTIITNYQNRYKNKYN